MCRCVLAKLKVVLLRFSDTNPAENKLLIGSAFYSQEKVKMFHFIEVRFMFGLQDVRKMISGVKSAFLDGGVSARAGQYYFKPNPIPDFNYFSFLFKRNCK